jgi:GTPase
MNDRAYLVEIKQSDQSQEQAQAHLAELKGLCESLGLEVAGETIAPLRNIYPALLLGSGKSEAITADARDIEADIIVIDDELSPAQQRNWERLSDLAVVDRQEIILEIFADRASTKEATLQVALARMEYSLPRLTRAWTHLSRQRGGTKGTRGEGETQLEADRRIVLRKISRLKKELEKVRGIRATGRKQRGSLPVPTAAIVGYTNAGKSSLLNALSGSGVAAEDRLFATLDPTTRRVDLPGGRTLLFTDTVGFIRKLPHSLVDAFRATLEETVLADIILIVADASDQEAEEQLKTTIEVLEEIGASDQARVLVMNKIDLPRAESFNQLSEKYQLESVNISAKTGAGIEELLQLISSHLAAWGKRRSYTIPTSRYDLVALLHREAKVLDEKHDGTSILVDAVTSEKTDSILQDFLIQKT